MAAGEGWFPFGLERVVTRAKENVVYEFDGQSALDLSKRYLGEHARRLPQNALMFPLVMRFADTNGVVVRGVTGISEEEHSLTFAGDVLKGPAGSTFRFVLPAYC